MTWRDATLALAIMVEILNQEIPADLQPHASLPGVRPLAADGWLNRDDAYAAQMAYRRQLIARKRPFVYWEAPEAQEAVFELVDEALALMPALGFSITSRHIFCPDGTEVDREGDAPLAILGRVLQEDICILQKKGEEHVLTAAVLCFPAGWTLAEKAGRPLIGIHRRVAEYDAGLAKRVQRMFDGVHAGRPLWRNNYLRYDNPDLFQPLTEEEANRRAPAKEPEKAGYLRAERQSILRLPKTRAIVFTIHTYVARAD